MDLGFSRLDMVRADAAPIPLDYLRLIASLAAMQAASRTAAVEASLFAGTFTADPIAALVRLFEASHGWATAVDTLGGSFHPEIATPHPGQQA